MNPNVITAGLLVLVISICVAGAFDPIPKPRTLGHYSGKKYRPDGDRDSNSKLTVVKYSSSARGTRFRRDTLVDTAQIEAPPPMPMDMEPSTTIWPFSYLFGGPNRRRIVVSRRGRPFGTYRRKGWWPAGGAANRWW